MIAGVLHDEYRKRPGQGATTELIARALAGRLAEMNPRFDRDRFMDAVLTGRGLS